MLTELLVEGVGVIKHAELTLDDGSCALTGETGAGKTLLVAAVALLLGARADRTLVRTGTSRAVVEGRFLLPPDHPVVARLVAEDLLEHAPVSEAEVVVSRLITPDGRGRARINGRLVTVALLAQVTGALVEIAGQSEHGRINSGGEQRRLLDAFAGATKAAAVLAAAVRRAAGIERRLDSARAGARSRRRELDVTEFEVAEIEEASLVVGELEQLHTHAARLERAEKVASALEDAVEELRGEGGAVDRASSARAAVEAVQGQDPGLQAIGERLASSALELEDSAQELRALMLEPDPRALEQTNTRRAVIGRLLRKYGEDEAEVLAYLERARTRVGELSATEAGLSDLEAQLDAARLQAQTEAAGLAVVRLAAAPKLARAVEGELASLALEGASFHVRLEQQELGEAGTERVSFELAANSGEALKPLSKVASGGELSRIALALHLVVRRRGAPTMIFDEVDAGVGGKAALAVGRALAELARSSGAQVLMVTHLPQVAAFAEAHYRVASSADGAVVARVEASERVAELSRMLAGLPESERAQEHAQELLALASASEAKCTSP